MTFFKLVIVIVIGFLLISCDSGSKEKESESVQETTTNVAVPQMKTFEYTWSAICRCSGKMGGRKEQGEHGKLCSSDGTYTGQHATEEAAIEKMKADARKQMNCIDGPFITFRYEEP